MKNYFVEIEVEGPIAMFARPDTGGTPTSYPLPTWSAAKGILESIAFLKSGDAWFCPTKVEVCKHLGEAGGEVNYQRMTMNYGGPLRKKDLFSKGLISGGSSMQLAATVIAFSCYRIQAEIIQTHSTGLNSRHHLKDLFERRLRQGRCWRTPTLGWSEFVCTYWGPYRTREVRNDSGEWTENKLWKQYCEQLGIEFCDITEVDSALSIEIPSMLKHVWQSPVRGDYSPHFVTDQMIVDGVFSYGPSEIGAENA